MTCGAEAALSGDTAMERGISERAARSTCNAKATLSSEAALSGDAPWYKGIPERAAPYYEHHNLDV